jgi:hypothetical protein
MVLIVVPLELWVCRVTAERLRREMQRTNDGRIDVPVGSEYSAEPVPGPRDAMRQGNIDP